MTHAGIYSYPIYYKVACYNCLFFSSLFAPKNLNPCLARKLLTFFLSAIPKRESKVCQFVGVQWVPTIFLWKLLGQIVSEEEEEEEGGGGESISSSITRMQDGNAN
jgi:hypothetical protein